jgi:hypothetical protein
MSSKLTENAMPRKTKRILWSTLTILAIAAGAFVFATTPRRHATQTTEVNLRLNTAGSKDFSASVVKALNSAIPQGVLPFGPAQVVRFTVYSEGIFPREARVSPGVSVICIEDMSENSAGLVLQNELRLTLGQVVRGPGQWRGQSRITLVAGRYQVFDASRPAHRAALVVEP